MCVYFPLRINWGQKDSFGLEDSEVMTSQVLPEIEAHSNRQCWQIQSDASVQKGFNNPCSQCAFSPRRGAGERGADRKTEAAPKKSYTRGGKSTK